MENNSFKEDYTLIRENEFNPYKYVHLFFYTYNDSNLLLLLHRHAESRILSEFTTNILPTDDLPGYAIARIMSKNYRGLITHSNIEKICNNLELTEEDLNKDHEFKWYTIWNDHIFTEWLEKISEHHVQYDSIKGKMIYFIEMPKLDVENLNRNLEKLNYPYRFEYFVYKYSELDSLEINNINEETFRLMKFFDFNKHIQDTLEIFKEDKVDYYLILACKKQGNKRDQAGFFYFPALLPGMYRKNREKWLYILASSELPNHAILSKVKAVIIPGSEISVYHDVDFLRHTEEWIRNLIENYPKIKFLGLCFGMQLFISAIGGKVEQMGEGKFIAIGERLDFTDDFWELEFVKQSNVEKRRSLVIRQAHGDHVSCIPQHEKFKIITFASSDSCNVEIIATHDERVFCLQGHPEYATEFTICRAVPFSCIRSKIEPTIENMIMMKEKMLASEKYPSCDTVELRMICHSFLKN